MKTLNFMLQACAASVFHETTFAESEENQDLQSISNQNTVDFPCDRKELGAFDWFRLAAAVLIITIHTTPLIQINEYADLLLTGVIARTAVPFFFAVSGYFTPLSSTSELKKIYLKISAVYGIATAIYLPLGTYSADIKAILFKGTYFHLWYFPAFVLGAAIVIFLKKLPMPAAFIIALLLYAVGLCGDSYYSLIFPIEPFRNMYDVLFKIFSYTRNGFFIAPIFMLIGNALANKRPIKQRIFIILGLIVSVIWLTAERFLLRKVAYVPRDNMFIFLIPTTFFLILLLASVKAKPRPFIRHMSMWIYIIHPFIIHYIKKLGIEDPLQTAVIVTAISVPLAAAITFFAKKLKKISAKNKK